MADQAFVTGATGCVGANVAAALLAQGYRVRAMRRSTSSLAALADLDVELVTGDIFDLPSLTAAMEGCELVFHCAAVSDYWRTPAPRIYQVNVEGTRRVLQAALWTSVRRLVYTSSIGALGVPAPGHLLDESSTFNLPPRRFPYGHSKHLAEQEVHDAVARGLDAIIVNPSLVMGARDVHFIGGSALREVKRGLSWFAPAGGANWIDAETVGMGQVLAAKRGFTGERYILGGENLAHKEALAFIADTVGGKRPWLTLPRALTGAGAVAVDALNALWPGMLPFGGDQARMSGIEMYCNCQKAFQGLGLPRTPFHAAVKRAYAWYQANGYM
ncbi:MAG: NAD-dependent epimerase/dehydratase family protein [Chloroflexi bacterium]|nr:NAD-dependent epimerase/dehydratase family protein [Chloroflexota bacterium]MBL7198593.1 NAD-dependent epimerase/dehydratase family protein [Anaerolineae bacterium]